MYALCDLCVDASANALASVLIHKLCLCFSTAVYFLCGQLFSMLMWLYLRHVVLNSGDDRSMLVSDSDLQPANPLADMMGAKKDDAKNEGKKRVLFRDYDRGQIGEKIKGAVMQGLIVGGIVRKGLNASFLNLLL
jgi:hypothetical protein